MDAPQPRIVSGVGTATGANDKGKLIQAAMVAALEAAQAAGINDPDELRRIKLEARDRAIG
jgi:hypothetical protein